MLCNTNQDVRMNINTELELKGVHYSDIRLRGVGEKHNIFTGVNIPS